ncbi:MAG TPA: hypothetical protein VFF30_08205 [Nitrososphaerales archaeon]|nr:hypothetical protein [Nitrososphaerales archaeon]
MIVSSVVKVSVEPSDSKTTRDDHVSFLGHCAKAIVAEIRRHLISKYGQ